MTRRDLIVEAGKLAGLFGGVVALGAGCGGGSDDSGTQIKLSEERKKQLEAEQQATKDFYAKKKK